MSIFVEICEMSTERGRGDLRGLLVEIRTGEEPSLAILLTGAKTPEK